jgi:bisanhydrobacterioruberin hydratase
MSMMPKVFREVQEAKRFVIIVYGVGVLGLALPWSSSWFQYITPLTLVFSAYLLYRFQRPPFSPNGWMVLISVYLLGMFAEVIGVESGIIFGTYHYGNGLGFKVMGTPLVIGLNWALLTYASVAVFQDLKLHRLLKMCFAAMAMVLYDVVLEQVAPHLDMWYWKGGEVPIQNYLAWFLLSLLFTGMTIFSGIRIKNKLALTLLLVQWFFFVILWITFNLIG